MKFVHVADIHIGRGFATASFGAVKGKERRKEIKETLIRVVDYCEEHQTDVLLIAGDMFDEDHVTISELKDINSAFGRLSKTKVVISAGNHDPVMNDHSLYTLMDWCPQVHLFGPEMTSIYLEDIHTEIWGFSWHQKHLPPFALEAPLTFKEGAHQILMLHGDAYRENDYLYIDPKILKPLAMDYVALGHIHKPDFIEPWLAYPGSLEPLDFSETGAHGFIEGTIDQEGLKADFKPFAKRAFRQETLEVQGDMVYEDIRQSAQDLVKRFPEGDYMRLTLTGDVAPEVTLDLAMLRESLEGHCHYIELKDETALDLNLEQLEKDYEGTLIGHYIKALKNKAETEDIAAEALKRGLRLLLEGQVSS